MRTGNSIIKAFCRSMAAAALIIAFFLNPSVRANENSTQGLVGNLENCPPSYMLDHDTREATGFSVEIFGVLLLGLAAGGLVFLILLAIYYRSVFRLNRELKNEIRIREQAEESLRQFNTKLETLVKERTGQIQQALTEKETLLETIRQSEDRLHTILNSTDALIFVQDLMGRYVYFNGSEHFGLKAGDVIGKTPHDFFDAETAERLENRMQEAQKTGKRKTFESSITWNGEQLIFLDEFTPIFNSKGDVIATSCFCHNITELKNIESDLRSSEQRFRKIAELLPSGIVEMDAELSLTFINKAGFDIFGYAPEDMESGLNGIELLHPDDRPKAAKRLAAYQAGEDTPPTEYRVFKKDGSTIPVLFKAVPILDDGVICGYMASVTDISKLKAAEAVLLKKEEQFRQLFEKAPYALSLTDMNSGRITDVNEMFCDKTGFARETIIGYTATEKGFYTEKERQLYISHLRKTGTVAGMEMKFQAGNKVFHTRLFARVLTINDNECILTAFEDIAEIKETQEKLKRNEERLRLALSNAGQGIWDWHLETDEYYFDSGYYTLAGYEPDEFPSSYKSWESRVHPDDIKGTKKALRRCMEDGYRQYDVEFRFLRKDNSWMWIRAIGKVTERKEDGTPARFTGTHIDISESKRAEERLKTTLAEKETLLREIHHRVKNNLNVISSLLSLHRHSTLNEEAKTALRESQGRVYAMAAVHEALYNTNNLSGIDLVNYLENLSASIVKTYAVNQSKLKLLVKGDRVRISIETASPLGLIINELISNAMKYAFPGDRRGKIEVLVRKLDDRLELTVTDDGVGLPQGFDWRSSDSLGLRLVRLLAENQLGGSIEVSVKQGTRFAIRIPLAEVHGTG